MKLFHLIVLFVADAVIAGPTTCNECVGTDAASCSAKQKDDQVCASDKDSLGTTHCASAVGKYLDDFKGGNVNDVFFRGCFDCSSQKEACFALGGFLKGDKNWTLLQCEIECCTTDNCNNQFPTLSEDAITVFTPNASGPEECYECLTSDASACSLSQSKQSCSSMGDILGTTHCGSAVGKVRDEDGNINYGIFRSCINCADKKAACAAIGGFLKDKERFTLLECEIECCTGNYCNGQLVPTFIPPTTASGPEECYECLASDANACSLSQSKQSCSSMGDILGTTHCGSAVGKVRDEGGNINYGIFRSCINCADKKAACATIGAYLKDKERFTLLECEIECCTGNYCNGQLVPTLTPATTGDPSMAPSALANSGLLAFVLTFNIILYQF